MLSRTSKAALAAGLLAAMTLSGPGLGLDAVPAAQGAASHFQPGIVQGLPLLRPETVAGHPSQTHSRQRRARPAMECMVGGSPADFPEDIMMTATMRIPQGAVANWSIANSPFRGTAVLPEMRAGQSVFVPHVLPGGLPAGIPCTAQVIWY